MINNNYYNNINNNYNSKTNDDLKAFERRLIEIVSCYEPIAKKWRILLTSHILVAAISAFLFISDPATSQISLFESLRIYKYSTANLIIITILLLFGVHKRISAPDLIVSRIKQVLRNYNMSCDRSGRLILKRPTLNRFIAINNNGKINDDV